MIFINQVVLYVQTGKSSSKRRHDYYFTDLRWLHICQMIRLNHDLLNDNTAKLLANHGTDRQNSAFLIESYHRKILCYFSEKQIGIQSAACYCNFIEFTTKAFFPPS